LDASGKLQWVQAVGGTGFDFGLDIAFKNEENIYILGQFNDIVDFDPNSSKGLVASAGSGDFFILKLNQEGSGVSIDRFEARQLSLYPNPNRGEFSIELPQDIRSANYTLINVQSIPVCQGVVSHTNSHIQTMGLSAGLYIMHLRDNHGNIYQGKMKIVR
jgi:hypothetical protein